jgi:hypothetical protein
MDDLLPVIQDMNESLGALRKAIVALHNTLMVMFGGLLLIVVIWALFFLR